MKTTYSLLICVFAFLSLSGYGQSKYLVSFTNKDHVTFDPYKYFDVQAIERRLRQGIPLNTYTDRPVREDYVKHVESMVDSCGRTLRWFNSVVVFVSGQQVNAIKQLQFVKSVEPLGDYTANLAEFKSSASDDIDYGELLLAKAQLERMGSVHFDSAQLSGKGVRVAILDAGFPGVPTLEYFEHIRERSGIIAHYDFVKNKPETYKGHKHGTMVLSNIAGKIDNIKLGMAPDAEFLLARTEAILKEGISDEENWMAAVEWADKNGADIINSSLGYTKRLYFRKDMDGKTSLISKAANIAARKGILVINSAGNEGSDPSWVTIGSPADADSVLAVGGINPWTNMHSSWSSYGPSADKRLKPNVCAYGHATVAHASGIEVSTGTSFASPLTVGFAACAWQGDRNLTNMELFKQIEMSAELYPYFDYAHGYGVPQASFFTKTDTSYSIDTTFDIRNTKNGDLLITIRKSAFERNTLHMRNYYYDYNNHLFDNEETYTLHEGQKINLKNKAFIHYSDVSHDSNGTGILYGEIPYFLYHVATEQSYLSTYFVLGVEKLEVLRIPKEDLDLIEGEFLKFYYKGCIQTYKL